MTTARFEVIDQCEELLRPVEGFKFLVPEGTPYTKLQWAVIGPEGKVAEYRNAISAEAHAAKLNA